MLSRNHGSRRKTKEFRELYCLPRDRFSLVQDDRAEMALPTYLVFLARLTGNTHTHAPGLNHTYLLRARLKKVR
jgi:hypothetical protein